MWFLIIVLAVLAVGWLAVTRRSSEADISLRTLAGELRSDARDHASQAWDTYRDYWTGEG